MFHGNSENLSYVIHGGSDRTVRLCLILAKLSFKTRPERVMDSEFVNICIYTN